MRKSGKKEVKSLWHSCDKSGVKIIKTKLEFFENDQNSIIDGSILNEVLHKNKLITSLPNEIDIKDAPTTYLQRYVFIPESICVLCNFTIGCNLLIEVGNKKFVKNSWTISDKYLDEVFTISEGNHAFLQKFKAILNFHF